MDKLIKDLSQTANKIIDSKGDLSEEQKKQIIKILQELKNATKSDTDWEKFALCN